MNTHSKKSLLPVFFFLAIALVFFFWPNFQAALAPRPTMPAIPAGGTLPPWLAVYFTDPNPPDNLGHGIDQYVLPAIDGAVKTIDVTSFDLNLPSLVEALVKANQRGVRVRVVYDGMNGSNTLDNAVTGSQPFDAIQTLKNGGVSLVDGGRTSGLMHDKMILIDGKTLFTGSWNLSYNDTYRNNNNLLKITAPGLIANYQARFNEMFEEKRFGAGVHARIPNPSLTIANVRVENYMAPEDGVMARLVEAVNRAQKSVHFMIFTFTHDALAKAMVERYRDKIDVQGVIEANNADQGSLPNLFCAGLPVRTDGNRFVMHHKVIIIDAETVITGSFNFTWSADTENDENVLVIHDPAVAALYEAEYQKMYRQGQAPQAFEIKCTD